MNIKWVIIKQEIELYALDKFLYKNKDIIKLNLKNILAHSDNMMFKSLNDPRIHLYKIERIKEHIKNNGYFDIPEIWCDTSTEIPIIKIVNGRHRTIFCYENGIQELYFLTQHNQTKILQKYFTMTLSELHKKIKSGFFL